MKEIIQEILISLVKCTSVCKTWRSMIINRSFIHPHLNPKVDFANQNDIDLLLLHRISGSCSLTYYQNNVIHKVKDDVHSVHHDNQAFDVYSKIEFPIAAKKNFWEFTSSCDPTIRKLVTLPRPGITFRTHGGYDASIGFGFDAMTNDYKVVRFVTLQNEDEGPTVAEVYSLATGTWRSLGCEVFGKIPMPKIIHWNPNWGLQLSVSDNKKSIALFMRPNNREDFYMNYLREESVLDIWVMKEYGIEESWTKLITLSHKSGEVLLLLKEKERQELVSLDLVSKQFKLLGISGYKYCTGHFYKESLLLLDKGDAESY
ncbi:uncharacterized protein LOC110750419 [Prunus avium]|uniref:Uncharacterized protein LOC110750419 n=1 Tax=Prunus avium TaxID=42229 RepID=A0A6P5RV21_PRUAV|nr:uncharacterized protein LOC110750419 [Prunus avium]